MVGLLILGRTYCFPLSCGHLKESHQPPMKRYFFGAFVTFVSNRRCHIEVLRAMCFNSFPAWTRFYDEHRVIVCMQRFFLALLPRNPRSASFAS